MSNKIFILLLISSILNLNQTVFAKLQKIEKSSIENQKINVFINKKQFSLLSPKQREDYVRLMQKAFFELETAVSSPSELVSLVDFLISQKAFAASDRSCVIGGQLREKVNGKCPTTGLSCEDGSDSFRCGDLFGATCIDRNPISTISKRCYQSSKPDNVTPENFIKVANNANAIFSEICTDSSKSNSCKLAKKRFDEISDFNRKLSNENLKIIEASEVPSGEVKDEVKVREVKKEDSEENNKCIPENLATERCVEGSYSVISCDNPIITKPRSWVNNCKGYGLLYCNKDNYLGFEYLIPSQKLSDFLTKSENTVVFEQILKKENIKKENYINILSGDFISYYDSDKQFVTNLAQSLNKQSNLCKQIVDLDKNLGPMSPCNLKEDNELKKTKVSYVEFDPSSINNIDLDAEIAKCNNGDKSKLKMYMLKEIRDKTFMILTNYQKTKSEISVTYLDEWGHENTKVVKNTRFIKTPPDLYEVDSCRLRESASYTKSNPNSDNICMILLRHERYRNSGSSRANGSAPNNNNYKSSR